MRKPKEPPKLTLIMIFSLNVFVILVLTMLAVGMAIYAMVSAGIIAAPSQGTFIAAIAVASIIVGTFFSMLFGRIPMKPVNRIIYALNSLAAGNYDTRLSLGGFKAGRDIEESFNVMAEELQNTEMLRSDFVNDFSHEFKTPLVSMQGFARLLQKGGLPKDKEKEYIDIIACESARLADMASKVLDLTKLENQSILTDVTEYNLSEQIRECVLLLEKKWNAKNLGISADFGEYMISANKEMLSQVWINLIDNAIKYSYPDTEIAISIQDKGGCITVSIADSGDVISEDEQRRIFRKFYQCDTSHASQGNGIGLAIVSRIVKLHEGEITVESTPELTVFSVKLPG